MQPRSYDTIQDYLVAHGYSVNEEQGYFFVWRNEFVRIEIPFAALFGHSVVTFAEKAKRQGWVEVDS
jgi:hypothetical protein